MDFNLIDLLNKMRLFWKEHDGEVFRVEDIRTVFSIAEIDYMLTNDGWDFYFERDFFQNFNNKIKSIDGLLTAEEAMNCIECHDVESRHYLFRYLEDEQLNQLLRSKYVYNVIYELASSYSCDKARVDAMKYTKNPYFKATLLVNCESDEVKLKHLWKISKERKTSVICSLSDDYLIEKYITMFRGNKGEIICGLQSKERKMYYLNKYFLVLNYEEKADIINSIGVADVIEELLPRLDDRTKGKVLSNAGRNLSINQVIMVMDSIKSSRVKGDVLRDCTFDLEILTRYLDTITNKKQLAEILSYMSSGDLVVYLKKLPNNKRIEIIKDLNYDFMFLAFKQLDSVDDIISIMEHVEYFPLYNDEYEYLVDMYAEKYNVNRERLLYMVKNFSLSVFKYIKSANMMKILNSSDEEFKKLMDLFDPKILTFNHSSVNDIVNLVLQREFRMKNPDIMFLLTNIKNAIEVGDRNKLVELLNFINESLNIQNYLNVKGWSSEEFIDKLINSDSEALELIDDITSVFVRDKRNNYVQKNLDNMMESFFHFSYDRKDVIKWVFDNLPAEYIYKVLGDESVYTGRFTQQELELYNNRDLLKRIIDFKLNPKGYSKMPQDVKEHLKAFYGLFDKTFDALLLRSFDGFNGKKNYEYERLDKNYIMTILLHLDLDKLSKGLFNDEVMFERFMKWWKQYKVGGWDTTMCNRMSLSGLYVDAEIIANFIQYFGIAYEDLENKVEVGLLNEITLSALLDAVDCFSTESKKYYTIFGFENFKLLSSNPGYQVSLVDKKERIDTAIGLIEKMRSRKYVTVPAFDEKYTLKNKKEINVVVGNTSDMINFTYGERTDACMRIGGAGEDLFNFCMLNESGFHVRFVNPENGKLISRVSCFRNGNTVFFNQLRETLDTDYDDRDLIDACKMVATELIERTRGSVVPIDNVFITPDKAMKNSGVPVKNYGIKQPHKGLGKIYHDYNGDMILLASSKPDNSYVPAKLGIRNLPKYDVQRGYNRVLYNTECCEYVAHIHSLDLIINGVSVEHLNVEIRKDLVVCLAGEDWYVAVDRNGNIEHYIMQNTNNRTLAVREMQEALEYLKENLSIEIEKASSVNLGM